LRGRPGERGEMRATEERHRGDGGEGAPGSGENSSLEGMRVILREKVQ